MATMSVKKSLALPGTFEPNALYMISKGTDQAVLYVANSTGTAVRALVSPIQQAQIDDIAETAKQIYIGFHNRIMNPQGVIQQVNPSSAVTDSAGQSPFACDRWRCVTRTGATIQAGTGLTPSPGLYPFIFVKIQAAKTSVAATDQFRLVQGIEGRNVRDMKMGTVDAATVTISFRSVHTVAGKYNVALYNSATNRSCVLEYNQDVADVWQDQSITVKLDTAGTWLTDTGVGIGVSFDYGSGNNYVTSTVGVWQDGFFLRSTGSVSLVTMVNQTLHLTDIQFAFAGINPKLQVRPTGIELVLCQRYFERIAAGEVRTFNGTSSPLTVSINPTWKVTKRTTPTVVMDSGTIEVSGINSASGYGGVNAATWFNPGNITAFADY